MTDNIVKLPDPPKPPEWMIGPFEEWRVVIEGREIPKLQARKFESRPGTVSFLLDHRFGLDVPEELAYQVAWYVANAMAIGAGYAYLGADEKFKPFAVKLNAID
jgi:hypothetical protein